MSLLFFLRDWDDDFGADRRYFEPRFDSQPAKRKKKKAYKIVMYGKTAEAQPVSLEAMATELFNGYQARRRRREEETLIFHLINEGL